VITLEFGEKAQAEDIQKALKEAKMPKDIVAIREKLEPQKEAKEGEKEEEDEDEKKEEMKEESKSDETKTAAEKQQEAKDDKKESKVPVTEKKESESETPPSLEERVLVPSVRTIDESVDMVRRLSASAK